MIKNLHTNYDADIKVISICILSIPFLIYLQRHGEENLLNNQRFLSSSYHFLYSRELFVLFRVTLLEEKKTPVNLRD